MQMADRLYEGTDFSKQTSKDVVDAFFESIAASLERNTPVKLSGFGNFELRDKQERPGRNPKTGEVVVVAARRVVTFHPGQKLRVRVARLPE